MKAIDLILPEPKTELELHERWKNRMQSELTSLNRYRKTIEVKGESQAEAIARRTKDWPMYDPDPNHCSGRGQRLCLKQGKHNTFNHSQDGMSSVGNLPVGFQEP